MNICKYVVNDEYLQWELRSYSILNILKLERTE